MYAKRFLSFLLHYTHKYPTTESYQAQLHLRYFKTLQTFLLGVGFLTALFLVGVILSVFLFLMFDAEYFLAHSTLQNLLDFEKNCSFIPKKPQNSQVPVHWTKEHNLIKCLHENMHRKRCSKLCGLYIIIIIYNTAINIKQSN